MSDGLRGILEQLLGDGRCPLSRLSARSRQALQPLLDSGVLRQVRHGRGVVVEVVRREAVAAFLRNAYPRPEPLAGPPRAAAVARVRDAKRASRSSAEPVLFRARRPLGASRGQLNVDLRALTEVAGAACLVVDDGPPWSMAGHLAVVENLECFLHYEDLGLSVDGALYAGGRLSARCLDWLATSSMAACDFLHCGDYDPTGLSEYLRLRERLQHRVRLHVPGNLPALLATYGKAELLRKSAPLLARLRGCTEPEVRAVVDALDASGCGLEQEALLISILRPVAGSGSCPG